MTVIDEVFPKIIPYIARELNLAGVVDTYNVTGGVNKEDY